MSSHEYMNTGLIPYLSLCFLMYTYNLWTTRPNRPPTTHLMVRNNGFEHERRK